MKRVITHLCTKCQITFDTILDDAINGVVSLDCPNPECLKKHLRIQKNGKLEAYTL